MTPLDRLEEYAGLAAKVGRTHLRRLLDERDEVAQVACGRTEVHSFFVSAGRKAALRRRIRAAVLTLRLIRRFYVEESARARAKRARFSGGG